MCRAIYWDTRNIYMVGTMTVLAQMKFGCSDGSMGYHSRLTFTGGGMFNDHWIHAKLPKDLASQSAGVADMMWSNAAQPRKKNFRKPSKLENSFGMRLVRGFRWIRSSLQIYLTTYHILTHSALLFCNCRRCHWCFGIINLCHAAAHAHRCTGSHRYMSLGCAFDSDCQGCGVDYYCVSISKFPGFDTRLTCMAGLVSLQI
ncbi:hypothetical protein DFJ58DRAFT_809893 [Suillus subalutaceus]|uniref:uncharacterized protein n=1 Tax=Suillus subalutaceus TaxID=48586 RepID=UPI001B88045E|nr:uncharacterized protein DFJ58DRAFT_809893 [Suillus subalutaceus]KAG1840702.1 hypothetical protein DFJ58DRAFT_809893 [Suillus subalutaceus]